MAYAFNATLTVSQSIAYNNSATSQGGFVYATRSSAITVTDDCSIIHNKADSDGGTLALEGNSMAIIRKSMFDKIRRKAVEEWYLHKTGAL